MENPMQTPALTLEFDARLQAATEQIRSECLNMEAQNAELREIVARTPRLWNA